MHKIESIQTGEKKIGIFYWYLFTEFYKKLQYVSIQCPFYLSDNFLWLEGVQNHS